MQLSISIWTDGMLTMRGRMRLETSLLTQFLYIGWRLACTQDCYKSRTNNNKRNIYEIGDVSNVTAINISVTIDREIQPVQTRIAQAKKFRKRMPTCQF